MSLWGYFFIQTTTLGLQASMWSHPAFRIGAGIYLRFSCFQLSSLGSSPRPGPTHVNVYSSFFRLSILEDHSQGTDDNFGLACCAVEMTDVWPICCTVVGDRQRKSPEGQVFKQTLQRVSPNSSCRENVRPVLT